MMRYEDDEGVSPTRVYCDLRTISMALGISLRLVEAIILEHEVDRLAADARQHIDRERFDAEKRFKIRMTEKDRLLEKACQPEQLKKDATFTLADCQIGV